MNTPPVDLLAAHAVAHPDKPAVIDDRSGHPAIRWSFDELNRQANRLGNALLGLGVRPGETVLWCGMNSPGVVRMMHAARKAGVTSVPLNYRLTPEEAAYIVDDSDAVAVYADAEFAAHFAQVRPHTPKVRHWLVYGGESNETSASADMIDAEDRKSVV